MTMSMIRRGGDRYFFRDKLIAKPERVIPACTNMDDDNDNVYDDHDDDDDHLDDYDNKE